MKTQTDMVLDYMKEFNSITPVQAFADLGCMRLGARIWELKKKGHEVISELVESKNRWGNPVRYAKYSLSQKSWTDGIKTQYTPDNPAEGG